MKKTILLLCTLFVMSYVKAQDLTQIQLTNNSGRYQIQAVINAPNKSADELYRLCERWKMYTSQNSTIYYSLLDIDYYTMILDVTTTTISTPIYNKFTRRYSDYQNTMEFKMKIETQDEMVRVIIYNITDSEKYYNNAAAHIYNIKVDYGTMESWDNDKLRSNMKEMLEKRKVDFLNYVKGFLITFKAYILVNQNKIE